MTLGRAKDPPPQGMSWQMNPGPPPHRHLPCPSLQKLVQPHLIACFLPANTESVLTEEPAQGALGTPHPAGLQGCQPLTLVEPAGQAGSCWSAAAEDVVVALNACSWGRCRL